MNIVSKLRKRLASDKGFTLIELLVVLVIIGILLAIAVPSYLGFKDRAEQKGASANVRAAIPAAEAYYADNGTYAWAGGGVAPAALKAVDSGLSPTIVAFGDADSYCLSETKNTKRSKIIGPGGTITEGATTAVTACTNGNG